MSNDDNFHHRDPKNVGPSPLRAAVQSLGRFLEAGRDLAHAWDELPRGETLDEGYPAMHPVFSTVVEQLAGWYGRQAGRLPPDQAPDGVVYATVVYSTPRGGPAPRPFGVRLVRKGDHWGRGGACLHTSDDPLVEVYDLGFVSPQFPTPWWDAWPNVLLASLYHASSLMGRDLEQTLSAARAGRASGLSLHHGEPEWSLDPAAMVQVIRWLESLRNAGVIELRAAE